MQSYEETPIFHVFLLSFLVLLIAKWLSQNTTINKQGMPPSPPRLPLIGNLHQLGIYPYRSFRALSQKYGDLILLYLGSKSPTIVISSAELASEILKTNDAIFASRPKLRTLRLLLGDGKDVFSSPYGEHWRRMKSICIHEILSKKRVESYRKVMEEEVDLIVKEIERLGVVDLSKMFMTLSNDLICRVALGRKYSGYDERGVDFNKLVNEFMELIGGYYVGDLVSWLGWIDRIKGVNNRVNRVAKTFDVFIERILEEHIGERNGKEGEYKDFVDILLEIQSQDSSRNQALDKHSIKCLLMDMFVAATHAIWVVLQWMMTELIKNPRIMEELRKEILMVIGNKGVVTEDDLKSMNYLKSVLKETLRVHIPGPFLVPHVSTHDAKINGFHIAAGTQVVVNAWSICRDPRYWEEPEKFFPERFLGSTRNFKGHDFEFIPFGSGRRMCPGMEFATSMIELVIANLVLRFEWSLPNGEAREGLDMSETMGLLFIRKKKPLVVVASPRTQIVD